MQLVWDEAKRCSNLIKHGLDFADAEKLLENGTMRVWPDFRNDELRFIGMGLVGGRVVSLAYMPLSEGRVRIISFRKANKREQKIYYQK